ncbi:centromere protein C isoform X2 [Jatropha curcas]|uniref:centromere protein C isoform X2 n=1 Tax=Jatropha curcas TaxID=180498 RepID=UPI0009D6F9CA|nr:centromere protein C isoform X2 [Jatropha curcas]
MANLADPLEGYGELSLFPRTFASLPNPSRPLNSDDPRSIHDYLKSLPVKNPDRLIQQAKSILENTAEAPETEMTNIAATEDKDVVTEKAVQYPWGQRPGLNRKRPRFSLLPNISQPTVDLEPTLDFDKLKDPEEFFSAYERLENAKKEIAKQTGRAFTDSDQYNVFKVPRSQRPGIPGRSTAKYKHLYPTMSSQEMSGVDILPNCGSQQEGVYPDLASQQTEPVNVSPQQLGLTNDASQQTEPANVASEEMELTGSLLKAENRVGKLLDELLGNDLEELDEDGTTNLLQELLQIKPLHIEKLNLPEVQDIQEVDCKASGVNLLKPRKVLSDMNTLLKATRNVTPLKLKNIESLLSGFGSPTPPKSPLASLSLLKKHIFQSNPSSDPFSAVDIDDSPARITPVGNINKRSDPVDVENALRSVELDPVTSEENDGVVITRSSTKVAIEGFSSSHEKGVNENLSNLVSGSEIGPRECGPELDDNNIGMDVEVINGKSWADVDADIQTNENNELDMTEDVQQEAMASAQPDGKSDEFPVQTSNSIQNKLNTGSSGEHTTDGDHGIQDGAPEQTKDTAPEQQNEKIQEPKVKSKKKQHKVKSSSTRRQDNKAISKGQSLADSTVLEDQPMDLCLECQDNALDQTQDTASENNNKKNQESIAVSMDERTKANSCPSKKNKCTTRSRGKSLAGCGMSWEAGLRRSTRIRSRPLEYWKGERFLYGRVHESLATIIGIKYESPGKDKGGPTMKVKSFVSDKYKNLVEQAALY